MKKESVIAFVWGFAEATLFFIVPDVFLMMVALKSYRKSLLCSLYALIGALIGGALIYFWGKESFETVSSLFIHIPGINQGMIETVRSKITHEGMWSVLWGPALGIPYKIYAALLGEMGRSFWAFMAISTPARFIRFFLLSSLAAGVDHLCLKKIRMRTRITIVSVAWFLFYLLYFSKMGW